MHAAPLMLGDRAIEKVMTRKSKVSTYMNDLQLIGDYWGWYDSRFYHHTGMVSMTYAMREALEVVKVCSSLSVAERSIIAWVPFLQGASVLTLAVCSKEQESLF